MASHGGKREGAGRKKGAVARAKAIEKKNFAVQVREYAPAALKLLADVVEDNEARHSDRISAAKELLDRSYGKAPQALKLGGDEDEPIHMEIRRVIVRPY